MSGVLGGLLSTLGSVGLVGISSASNTSGSTLAISVPATAISGDTLVVMGIHGTGAASWNSLTGWSERRDSNGRLISSRVWDGVSSSYTYGSSSSDSKTLVMLAFRNFAWDASFTISSFTTNPVASSFTIGASNSILVGLATNPEASQEWTAPSGWTKIFSATSPNSISIWKDNNLRASGSSGTTTFTRTAGTLTGRAQQFSVSPT